MARSPSGLRDRVEILVAAHEHLVVHERRRRVEAVIETPRRNLTSSSGSRGGVLVFATMIMWSRQVGSLASLSQAWNHLRPFATNVNWLRRFSEKTGRRRPGLSPRISTRCTRTRAIA